MNLKSSVNNTTRINKIPLMRLAGDYRTNTENYTKETNENTSPNYEGKVTTPKTYLLKNVLNTTNFSDKKPKSFNFNIKKKVLSAFSQQKDDSYKRANTERVKISSKNFGIIHSYAAITTEGCVR
jgi:hypothetical protein